MVEDCVNKVGVDLNTASAPLLSYISGISGTLRKILLPTGKKMENLRIEKNFSKYQNLDQKHLSSVPGL